MNHILDRIYSSVISSQAWVSFCLAMFVWFFMITNNIKSHNLIWIGFFSTLLAYNLAYWVEDKRTNYRLLVIILSAIAAFYFFLQLDLFSKIIIAISGVISILYSISSEKFNLRNIPGMKIFWIAIVWTLTVALTFDKIDIFNNVESWYKLLSVFFFIIGITIPFDMRDIANDKKDLRTIPQVFGLHVSKIISCLSLMVGGLLFYISYESNLDIYIVSYSLTIALGLPLIIFQNLYSKWYTSFWIESLSACPIIFYFILSYFIS